LHSAWSSRWPSAWAVGRSSRICRLRLPGAPRRFRRSRLSTQDGRPFDLESLKGKWSFVYFGLTYAADVCPTTLAELGDRARKLLEERGGRRHPVRPSWSVDPQRDHAASASLSTAFFDRTFLGRDRGSNEALERPHPPDRRRLRVSGGKERRPLRGRPLLDRGAVRPRRSPARAVFTPPQEAQGIAEGFRKIRSKI